MGDSLISNMSGSEDDLGELRINNEYAKRYDRWREKEELQKLKDKYGHLTDKETSSSESEDEDAEALTAQIEKDWLRTLAAIKNKDPKIYDPSVKFFSEEDTKVSASDHHQKTKDKPLFLKDYERKVILEKGGVISDDDDDDEEGLSAKIKSKKNDPSYYEEQEEIKRSLKAAIGDSGDSDDEDLLIPRKKDKEEEEREEEEYLLWLKGQKQELESDKKVGIEIDPLKEYWNKPDLSEGEKFLRDYFLDKKYLDDEDDDRIPTYDEIIQDEDISEEEKEIEKQEEFERKYNFRFEEPDPEFIKTYPRTIGDSVRRKKDKRAKKRQADRERKKKEKEKKMEELKQLKNLKKKEILEKLEKIKEITGNNNVGFTEEDIEGDFDPANHDKIMKEMFDDSYYMDADGEKPVFSDDDELDLDDGCWDDWPGRGSSSADGDQHHVKDKHESEQFYEDDDFNMDADYEPSQNMKSYSSEKKHKKKKSKFAQALERQKPIFNPGEKTFDEYFDEYYKLDYEDIIGDLPCRFKYRSVVKNDFGLDTAEILTCPDRELNAWVSLKKMTQYRTVEEEEYDKKVYSKKARQLKKKMHVMPSLFKNNSDHPVTQKASTADVQTKRRKSKRKRITSPAAFQHLDNEVSSNDKISSEKEHCKAVEESKNECCFKKSKEDSDHFTKSEQQVSSVRNYHSNMNINSTDVYSKKKSKKKKKKDSANTISRGFNMSDDRLKAYGINPKKFKYTYLKKLHEDKKESTV